MGTAGQYLKVNSGGTDIEWATDSLTFALNDASDVTISTPKRNQSIEYDASGWINSLTDPILDKAGEWAAILENPAYGTGLLAMGMEANGTITRSDDATSGHEGTNLSFTTISASTINTVGLKQTVSYYRRNKYSRYYATIYCDDFTSNTRAYFGFASSSSDLSGDTPLEGGVAGVLIGITSAEAGAATQFQVIHNDTAGVQTKVASGVAWDSNANYHDFEIALSLTDAKAYIDGTLVATVTTELPATTTALYPHWIVNRIGGSDKNFHLMKAGVRSR